MPGAGTPRSLRRTASGCSRETWPWPFWNGWSPRRRSGGCWAAGAAPRGGRRATAHSAGAGPVTGAWASLKSFQRRDTPTSPPDDPGNPTVDFHGERRRNDTHRSTTDPEARLAQKGPGKEAKLAYQGHALMDNRHGLVVNACATQARGTAEREAAVATATGLPERATLGADKGYDTHAF